MSTNKKHNITVSAANLTSEELLTVNSTDTMYSNNQQVQKENVTNNQKNEDVQAVNNYTNYKARKTENVPERTNEYNNYPNEYKNYSEPNNQVKSAQQESLVNSLDNLSFIDPNATKSQKMNNSQYPQYLTESNNINNSRNMVYNKNRANDSYFGKNALLLNSNVVDNDRYSADRVALNMEIERRVRMNTARYITDPSELSDNYSNDSVFLRNKIFGETLRVINEEGDWAQRQNNNKFYTTQNEQKLQSEIKEQFIKAKMEEKIRLEQAELANQAEQKTVIVEQKLMPKKVFIEPTHVAQELPKKELPKTTFVDQRQVVNGLNKTSFGEATVVAKELSQSTIAPILNITNEQKIDNFVKNFNNENGLNEAISARQVIGVDLNQNFYMSNEKLASSQNYASLNANNLSSLNENKKYIREDSLGYKIIEKHNEGSNASHTSNDEKELLDNVEKHNVDKIQSLEEILKSLTNELLSVKNPTPSTNNINNTLVGDAVSNKSNLNNNQAIQQTNNQTIYNTQNRATNFNPINMNIPTNSINRIRDNTNQLNSNKVIEDFNNKRENINQSSSNQVVNNFMDKKINFNPINNNQSFQKMNDVQRPSSLNSDAFQSNNNSNKNNDNQGINYGAPKPIFNANRPSINISQINEKPSMEQHNSSNANINYGTSPFSNSKVRNDSLDLISNENLANEIDKHSNMNMRKNDGSIKKPSFPFSKK